MSHSQHFRQGAGAQGAPRKWYSEWNREPAEHRLPFGALSTLQDSQSTHKPSAPPVELPTTRDDSGPSKIHKPTFQQELRAALREGSSPESGYKPSESTWSETSESNWSNSDDSAQDPEAVARYIKGFETIAPLFGCEETTDLMSNWLAARYICEQARKGGDWRRAAIIVLRRSKEKGEAEKKSLEIERSDYDALIHHGAELRSEKVSNVRANLIEDQIRVYEKISQLYVIIKMLKTCLKEAYGHEPRV